MKRENFLYYFINDASTTIFFPNAGAILFVLCSTFKIDLFYRHAIKELLIKKIQFIRRTRK